MPGRIYSSTAYKFGFNGQEKDDEVSGGGNTTTAQYWEYDSRLGRRFNPDGLANQWESPYSCFHNNPITFADPSGLSGTPKQYSIKEKDTYWDLANKSNKEYSVDDLKKWNPGIDPLKLKIGQKINVSDPNKALLIGARGTVGTDEDSKSSYNGQEGSKPVPGVGDVKAIMTASQLKDAELKRNFDEPFYEADNLASECASQDLYNTMNRFKSGQGGTYDDYYCIQTDMANCDEGRTATENIANAFKSQMQHYNGNYSNITINNIDSASFRTGPNNLRICSGGTQYIKIYIVSIKFMANNSYQAEIMYELHDDFGVSQLEVHSYGFPMDNFAAKTGLAAFWVLQHQRGYKPLINIYRITTTINGTY